MSEYTDLREMIEILHTAIVRQETEEEFFRRSAKHSTSETAKSLFTEIAEELKDYISSLEVRKQKLAQASNEINALKKN